MLQTPHSHITKPYTQHPKAELARKVASKIAAGERFAAYVVLPMYPEGGASSGAVQTILHLQRCTIAAVYRVVAEALREAGLLGRVHPQVRLLLLEFGLVDYVFAGSFDLLIVCVLVCVLDVFVCLLCLFAACVLLLAVFCLLALIVCMLALVVCLSGCLVALVCSVS